MCMDVKIVLFVGSRCLRKGRTRFLPGILPGLDIWVGEDSFFTTFVNEMIINFYIE